MSATMCPMRRGVLVLAAIAAACAEAPGRHGLAIVRGEPDLPEELPGVVRL